jgi:hypothetical protein
MERCRLSPSSSPSESLLSRMGGYHRLRGIPPPPREAPAVSWLLMITPSEVVPADVPHLDLPARGVRRRIGQAPPLEALDQDPLLLPSDDGPGPVGLGDGPAHEPVPGEAARNLVQRVLKEIESVASPRGVLVRSRMISRACHPGCWKKSQKTLATVCPVGAPMST